MLFCALGAGAGGEGAVMNRSVRLENLRDHKLWEGIMGSSSPPSRPRPGEDGSVVTGPCDHYRPMLHVPGYCWCGSGEWDHAVAECESCGAPLSHALVASDWEFIRCGCCQRPVEEDCGGWVSRSGPVSRDGAHGHAPWTCDDCLEHVRNQEAAGSR